MSSGIRPEITLFVPSVAEAVRLLLGQNAISVIEGT
jgi:hypothetical protein